MALTFVVRAQQGSALLQDTFSGAGARSFALANEPRPRHRHGRRLHLAAPHRGLRARHRAVGGAGLGRRWPTPSSWRSSCRTSSAACSPRAPSPRPSCRCSRASCRSDGRDAALTFARQAHAGLLVVLVPFSLLMIVAMPAVMWLLAPGPVRRRVDLRPRGRFRPHHLSLSGVHLARLALWRRAERHRPLRRGGLHAGAAEPRHDRRPCSA